MTLENVASLLVRVRAGDPLAAEELVRTYEPELRRAIGVRLRNSGMQRLVDSIDVCQSVFADFFAKPRASQYDLQTSHELLSLLVTTARNRMIDWKSHSHAHRPAGFQEVSLDDHDGHHISIVCHRPGPVSVLMHRELLEQVHNRLVSEEIQLIEKRAAGLDWQQIAAETGELPNTDRMRLTRAIHRVAEDLGLGPSCA